MSTLRHRLASIPALAVAATGLVTVTPSAHAATSAYISATSAGTKAVNQTTYVWGSTNALPGSTICTQALVAGNWSTSQCSTVTSSGNYTIPLTYGSSTPGTYTFRVIDSGVVSPTVTLTRTAATTTSTSTATSTATSDSYVKGRTTNGYTLYSGYNGVKVYLVQKALGITTSPMSSTMGPQTTAAVISFQRAHGIPATGVVDANTFYALKDLAPHKSYLAAYNFDVDSWTQPSQVSAGASHTTKVNAMIAWAKSQYGKPYIWGGTGPMGYDCSGLLIQALRAGGFSPSGVSNFIDVRPASDLSNQMLHDSELTKGSLSNIQVGDFIYYGGSDGVAHHVAMYIGNNTVINAIGSSVQYSSLSSNAGWPMKLGVNRLP